MKTASFWAATAMLAATILVGLVWLAPVTHGQVIVSSPDGGRSVVRQFQVLGGRGSSIGVTVRDVDEQDVTKYKLADRHGVMVDDVDQDGAADKAGIKAGDVVVTFDQEAVRSARQFSRLVEETPAGRQVSAAIVRNGAKLTVDVTPASGAGTRLGFRNNPSGGWPGENFRMFDLPAMPELRELERLPELRDEIDRVVGKSTLGVGAQSLTSELAEYFGVKEGVLVSSVQPDSPAAKAGLKAGDVITSVNGTSVESPSELRRELRETDSPDVTLGVMRDRKSLSLKATLERPERQAAKPRWPV